MKMLIIIIIIIYYYYAEAATYMPCNHTLHNYYKIKDNKKTNMSLLCHDSRSNQQYASKYVL